MAEGKSTRLGTSGSLSPVIQPVGTPIEDRMLPRASASEDGSIATVFFEFGKRAPS